MRPLRRAWLQLRPHLGALASAVLVVGLGIALAAASLLANRALRDGFEQSIDALAGRADLEVVARGDKAFDEAVLERVRAVPGVSAAAALLNEGAFLDLPDGPAVRVIGVDMLDEATLRVYERAEAAGIDDPLVFLNQPDSVLVPASLAREQELALGSRLPLRTPTGRGALRVRGILADRGVAEAFAGRVVVMDLFAAQARFAAQGTVSQIDVRAAPGEDVEALAKRIEAHLPEGLAVRDAAERKARFAATVAGFHDLLDVMAAMALLLAVVVAANRLATIYRSRLVELGVLRAIGADPASLVRGLCLEAGIVGVFAAAIGLPLGLLLAQGIVQPLAATMELNFKKATAAPWVSPATGPLVIAAAAGVLSAVGAAWLPARRAARSAVRAVLAGGADGAADAGATLGSEAARRRALRLRIGALVVAATLFLAQVAFSLPWLGGPVMVAALVVGGLLLGPALDLADAALSRIAGASARIGLRRRPGAGRRAAGAAAVAFVGIVMVVFVSSSARSFERFVVDTLLGVRHADLYVGLAFEMAHGDRVPQIPDEFRAELAAVPGVRRVATEAYDIVGEPPTGMLAIDPERFQSSDFGVWRLEPGALPDALERAARSEGVLADPRLLRSRKLAVGDRLRMDAPAGALDLPVLGAIQASFMSQAGDVVMSRELLRRYWLESRFTHGLVLVEPGADVELVRRAILERFGNRYGLDVIRRDEYAAWNADGVRRGFGFAGAIAVLVLVVVLVGTADSLAASVLERRREIGTMRALGAEPASVAWMVTAEALAIGLAGAGLGLVVGHVVAVAFLRGVMETALGWSVPLHLDPATVLAGTAIAVLACLIGALPPALRAAWLPPIGALRHE